MLKIALPSRLNLEAAEETANVVRERIKNHKAVLIDASEVRIIEPEGLDCLLAISGFVRDNRLPKVIIRRPSRVMRDVLILSNTLKLFEIIE
ncbi:MAG: STAS domain-containing protein [Nitrospirae bacterium]|nr:STAS domain-containing protein [Nitrospirota bacterium]